MNLVIEAKNKGLLNKIKTEKVSLKNSLDIGKSPKKRDEDENENNMQNTWNNFIDKNYMTYKKQLIAANKGVFLYYY